MANTKNKRRKKLIILAILALIIASSWLYVHFTRRDPVITVQTEKVIRRNITETVIATGRVQPVNYVKISPEVSGEIIELPVKEGQFVNKGDILFKIKPDFYLANRRSAMASLESAQANQRLAQANLAKAEAEYKRYKELFENKLISDSQFLEVKTAYDVAKANVEQSQHQVEMAQAALSRSEEELSKTTVFAPLSGIITKLNSQLGERVVGTATYQGTEVMTISDLNEMEARVDIGEIDVVLIKIGQKAKLEVDAFKDRKFSGLVTDIANTAKTSGLGSQQEATKFEVRIRILEKEAFRPGMSVTAEIETRYRTNVLAVPIQSVTTRMPKPTNSIATNKNGFFASIFSTKNKTAQQQTPSATNSVPRPSKSTNTPTNLTNQNNSTTTHNPGTNEIASPKKPNEPVKPIEVVFIVENDTAKMVPVKRGISDDSYVEILEGITENQEVVCGGYKAINRELEDGKKVKIDNSKSLFQETKTP